jgi:RecB family exonuclease
LRLREHGFPRAEVLSVVRDGLHAKTPIDVNEADAATRRARIAGGTSEELRRMRKRTPVIDTYIELVAELEELTATLDAALLARLGSLFRIETEADLAAAEKLDDIASLFRRIGNAPLLDVIDAIEHETLAQQMPSQGERVWAGEVLRFRGRSFTHLFAVRMQDDVFPQRRTEDPLLPDSDRRLVGIREIGDGADEERLLFSLLTESTSQSLQFSFASGDGFGKVLRPSRFVRTIPRTIAAATPTHRAPLAANRQLQLLVKTGTRSAFDGYLPPFDPERFRSFSPTQLEDFGECPQKFLLKHILRVEDLDHPERELQIHHRDKGTLDHSILERLYSAMDADDFREAAAALPHLPDALSTRLDALVDEHFDEHEAIAPPFNRTVRDIERRATKRILREFVVNDVADLAANDLTPKWFEYRFGAKHRDRGLVANHPEPFVIDAGGVPVRVEGTIDRIDESEAFLRIVDYKSGKALRHANLGEKIDRGVRLQLALYAMAVSEFFQADPASVSGTIKPLVQGEVKPAKFAFALDQKRESLLETLEIFIRAILAGHFPAFPNERDEDFNSCKYCPVNHSCRTKHDLDERYAVQQQRDPRTLLGGSR